MRYLAHFDLRDLTAAEAFGRMCLMLLAVLPSTFACALIGFLLVEKPVMELRP